MRNTRHNIKNTPNPPPPAPPPPPLPFTAAGVIVNLLAGMAGSRFGIKATLLAGLTCQLVALAMLAGWQKDWSMGAAVAYITVAQVLNGVAKVSEKERDRNEKRSPPWFF